MFEIRRKLSGLGIGAGRCCIAVAFLLMVPLTSNAGTKKKSAATTTPKATPVVDYSNIVWPNPPAIARIRYLAFYAAQKLSQVDTPKTAKQGWMDRLAGTVPEQDNTKVLFQLGSPTESLSIPRAGCM